MTNGEVLEFSGVTKRFGAVTAVSDFSARVEPGVVTGFLGPNGAGKTTSLRILLGLVRATAGTATIGGKPFAALADPLRTVGAVLEASSFHPGRTAANHLKVYAQAAQLPAARVDESLAAVGLTDVAGRKVGGFSLGMRQRLGLAFALLGDPSVLVLDEPTNGLDPEGIIWIRGFLRQLAREGRTVLVSSHLLAEVQQTADQLIILSHGRLVFHGSLGELSDPSEQSIVADSPDRAGLAAAFTCAGVSFENLRSGLTVRGGDAGELGAVALAAGVPLSALARRGPSLEEVFLDLVNGVRTHQSAAGGLAASIASAGADAASPTGDAAEAAPEVEYAAPSAGTEVTGSEIVAADAEVPVVETDVTASQVVAADAEVHDADAAKADPDTAAPAPSEDDADVHPDAELPTATDTDTEASATDAEPTRDATGAESDADADAEVDDATDIEPGADIANAVAEPLDTDPDTVDAESESDSEAESESDNDSTRSAADAEPVRNTAPIATGTVGFAVASTGIIDIVPGAGQADATAQPQDAHHSYSVASTGVIEVIDDVPSRVEPADQDAEAFFAAFDEDTEIDEDAEADEDANAEPAPEDTAQHPPVNDEEDDQR